MSVLGNLLGTNTKESKMNTPDTNAELVSMAARLADSELRANKLEAQFKSQCAITAAALDERAKLAAPSTSPAKLGYMLAERKALRAELEALKAAPSSSPDAQEPPYGSKRKAAMAIYTAPFKYYRGYIHDAQQNMVSDTDGVDSAVAARVRGWGRIGYMPNAEELQDEVGQMTCDALNAYYSTQTAPSASEEISRLKDLLGEVSAHFTRDDDLPNDLLPRIDAALKGGA